MSLVAYGASDDSDASDVEDSEVSQTTNAVGNVNQVKADDGKISDEDDYMPTSSRQASSTSTTTSSFQQILPTPATLSDLPAPKPADATSTTAVDAEDELEEEVKPKASQLANAPKPPPKKTKQPTRIIIPALRQEEEEEDTKKEVKPAAKSASGSGLFALLPPPMHGTKKQSNRPLIPYTLTKRPTTATKPTPAESSTTSTASNFDLPSQKHRSAFNALTGYESDSDDEEGEGGLAGGDNFFSLGGEAAAAQSLPSNIKDFTPSVSDRGDCEANQRTEDDDNENEAQTCTVTAGVSALAAKSESAVSSSSVSSSAAGKSEATQGLGGTVEDSDDDDHDEDDNAVSSTVGVPLVDQDAPLSFSGSSMSSHGWMSTAPLVSPMMAPEMYGATSSWQKHQHYAEDYAADVQEDMESMPGSSSGGIQPYMEDEQFLRISGKRKRGSDDIQIIDANVDDYVDPSDLMKGISEESSYQPHRKKDNMPSTQQRRKKQITYLAFQAKERELELKNAWSQNRMTKNQSRSKYGF